MNTISFYRPEYLWALGALAVPLIVHLLFRRRTRSLEFSTVRFIRVAAVKASRHRRLRRLAVLALRLLAVALLVLLFAHPFDRSEPFQALWGPQARVYCWVDPTVSMDYRLDGSALWRRALDLAGSVDSTIAPGAQVAYYDGRREEFVPWEEGREDPGIPRHGPTDFDRMILELHAIAQDRADMPVFIAFSDFQEEIASAFDTLFARDTLRFPVVCVMVGAASPWNYGIGGTAIHGARNAVARTEVRAQGRDLGDGEVTVRFGTMRTGHGRVACRTGDSASVELEVAIPADRSAGTVHLTAEDPFELDNTDYFTGRSDEGRRVLVLADGNAAYPVIAALGALREGRWSAPVVRHPAEVSYDELDSADIVVLCGIREESRGLQALVESGALSPKIIVFSPAVDPVFSGWNSRVFTHLNMDDCRPRRADRPLHAVLPDTLSQLWRRFPRTAERGAAVHEYFGPLSGTVLLRLDNGDPLASLLKDDRGNVWVVSATPLEISEANNLCETGFYVPFIDRLVDYASQMHGGGSARWTAGVPRRNPHYHDKRGARVSTEDGAFLALWETQQTVVLERPGLYYVQPVGRPAYWISAVIDPRETDFTYRRPRVGRHNQRMVRAMNADGFREWLGRPHGADVLSVGWLVLGIAMAAEALLAVRRRGEG